MYLVYLSNNGLTCPQKWDNNCGINAATGKAYETLKKIKLNEDEIKMSLDDLAKKYPFELKE